MFGGSMASLADPIPAIACLRLFPGYSVWTRSLYLDFRREARTDLELRFDFDSAIEALIRKELAARNRSTPTFEFGFYDLEDKVCVWVKNTVALRPEDPSAGGVAGRQRLKR